MIFTKRTFKFLSELSKNNQRDWFNDNKQRYEDDVRSPALEFINEIQPVLRSISPHFRAVSKKSGGSLMRIYRDMRFSKDKTPYKTNIGIQFRHEAGKDVHAPGFYLHIDPESVFLIAGMWRPDNKILKVLREMLADNPNAWKAALNNKEFKKYFYLTGESLKLPPRGYDKDHPLIIDLKRKDFIARHDLIREDIYKNNFADKLIETYSTSTPFMSYLCIALNLPF
ncbi:MAG TPA: DUF2461 domain-containing protein [Thiotrichaceae bacterium]|jgi:uncharacterized protein (TIGR02453 family)|nr:DUF2461 domain-containing protein [Thiotrichaceae bacterium]HIM08006.1 DUF2461 domain-containing protein [Gammaproteobacteria bacterium]